MVQGSRKSRTLRRVYVKTPGGTNKIHYKKRKPSYSKCANCKGRLLGVPRDRPIIIQKMSRSERKPSRPFGGNLCSPCMRAKIKSMIK